MAALVRIPWQPHLWLTPHTLAYLKRASAFYGANLYLYDNEWTRLSPAWRSYKQQQTAYDDYLHHGGPVASNPDYGQRNHMRGAAFDLRLTTARAQAACRMAGLHRDTAEGWHWNDPNWASMPIITTNPAASTGTATLIETEQFMPKVIYDRDTKQKYRYAVWDGGFTFDFITGTPEQIKVRRDRKLNIIGQKSAHSLSAGEFLSELGDVNANRAQAGLPEIVRPG